MDPTGKRISPALPADGVRALQDLIAESQSLRRQLDADRSLWKVRTRYALLMIVAILLMVGGLLTIVIQFEAERRDRSAANAANVRKITEISERIADCTTEGGGCYREGPARTAGVLAEVVRAQIAVEWCGRSPGVDSRRDLEVCVAREMAKPAPAPIPTPTPAPSPGG